MDEKKDAIKAYFDPKSGWRLFNPDGSEIHMTAKVSVTIDDNFGSYIQQYPEHFKTRNFIPIVRMEAICEIITQLPEGARNEL